MSQNAEPALLRRGRAQDVDRPSDVQALAQAARDCGPRAQAKSRRLVPRSEGLGWVGRHGWSGPDLGDELPVRPAEPKLAILLSRDLEALLVDRTMMVAT
jgi:hypothetical protein